MKKIILALMMISSFLFSSTPTYWYDSNSGVTYKKLSAYGENAMIQCGGEDFYQLIGNGPITYAHWVPVTYISQYKWICSVDAFVYKPINPNVDCPSGIVDGECTPPTPIPSCDYNQGKYLNTSTNTCTDCSSAQTVASRASCACDSQGSTYNNQSVTGTYTVTQGSTNYDRTDAKCANGGYIPILLNPRPVDGNTSTPTTPSTPTDNNTSGGGTGTGSGSGGTGGSGSGGSGSGGTTTPDSNTSTPTPTPTPTDTNTSGGSTGGGSTSGTNYADLIAQLKANNQSVNDFKDKFNQFATANQSNADKQLNATNAIKSAVDGTTSAVNTQGTAITNKLGDILSAIKDGNGTGKSGDGNSTNNVDLNATNKKLDTLHDDNNKTQGILDKIKDMFENNDSFKAPDVNATNPQLKDLLPDESWFNSNKMKLNFSSGSGDCYCQTAQFEVGGRTFTFPPQELLDMIPFDAISKMLMAFVYLIGLRQFLRN